jgi:integrase
MATLTIDGKRRFIYGCSDAEVRQKLQKVANTNTKNLTIADFLSQWKDRIILHLSPKTQRSYDGIIRLHITPHVGHYELLQLRPEHLYDLIEQLQRKNLSTRTVHYVLSVLSRALNWAVRWEYIEKNVVTLIKMPRITYKMIEPLTIDQAQALLMMLAGHRLEMLYRLALSFGMRQGELIDLKWGDIDMQRRLLHIRKSKTKAGRRTLEMPEPIYDALQQHKVRLDQERVAQDKWSEHGLVFPSNVGTPLQARNIFRHFKGILEKSGLPQTIRFHDLRHSCAAFLIAQGVDLHIVKHILGHSKISVTSDIYGHLLPGVGGSALGKVDDLLRF